ncbi:MAG TPA: phage tail assembly chaperone [Sphingomicrobium sp.]|nr:phage tail assembly chaperone [Sphingomicrobium sp.]
MTFGESALELSEYAAALLGWRPGDFWDSTPAELATAVGMDRNPPAQMGRAELEQLLSQLPDDRKN